MNTEFILRKWEIKDLDGLVLLADNLKIARFLTDAFPHPYTRESGEAYIMSISNDDPEKVFAIDINGKAVGSIGIFPQTDIHGYFSYLLNVVFA